MKADPLGLVGTTLDGRYRVDAVLGEGGYGVVYSGTHLSVGERIAIKCLRPLSASQTDAKRVADAFVREVRALFTLSHPNVVRMYDAGSVELPYGTVPYVVLELLDGPTLEDEIQKRASGQLPPWSFDEILAMFGTLLDALAFAHARGIVHRDLKPSNVILARTPSGVIPKLVDFGTARALDTARTSTGMGAFTPRYAAPEQWDAQYGTTGPCTDVFALGLMLEEACTLAPAIAGESHAKILASALQANRPISVAIRRPDLSAIESVVRKATRLNPHERFASMQEMADALRASAAARAVSFAPRSPIATTQPRPKSSALPIVLAAAAAVLVLTLGSGGVYLWWSGVLEPKPATSIATTTTTTTTIPLPLPTASATTATTASATTTATATAKPTSSKPAPTPTPTPTPAPTPTENKRKLVLELGTTSVRDTNFVRGEVSEVLNQRGPALAHCFTDPGVADRMTVDVGMDVPAAGGQALKVETRTRRYDGMPDTPQAPAVEACVSKDVKTWTFPPLKTHQPTTATSASFNFALYYVWKGVY